MPVLKDDIKRKGASGVLLKIHNTFISNHSEGIKANWESS